VVDDHKMFAESLVRMLGDEPDMGVVGLAGSAKEAVDATFEHRPDVVLLDYDLPDDHGTAAAVAVRDAHPRAKLVMLTGHADATVLAEAIEAGCTGFVTKDKATHELLSAVRAAAAGETAISPELLAQLLPTIRGSERSLERDPAALTPREQQVLELLAEGESTTAIAETLFLSRNTVRNHVQRLLGKLGAHSKLEAVAIGARRGLVGQRRSVN